MSHPILPRSGFLGLAALAALLPLSAAIAAPAPGTTTVSTRDMDGESYVFFSAAGESVALGASDQQLAEAQEIAGPSGGELLWARRGGKTWVVRDAALLSQVHALVDSQFGLGGRQGQLGGSQQELAEKQLELGNKNLELGEQVLALKARMKSAKGQEKADLQKELKALDEQQGELGRQQAELGKRQTELGKQQAEIGKQQSAESKRAQAGIEEIVEEAIRKGLAQEVQ